MPPSTHNHETHPDVVLRKPGLVAFWEPFPVDEASGSTTPDATNHPEGSTDSLPVAAASDPAAIGEAIYRLSGVIRVYSYRNGVVDGRPVVFGPDGATVRDFAIALDRRNAERFRKARIHGRAGFDGQMVGMDYRLSDGDRVLLL